MAEGSFSTHTVPPPFLYSLFRHPSTQARLNSQVPFDNFTLLIIFPEASRKALTVH